MTALLTRIANRNLSGIFKRNFLTCIADFQNVQKGPVLGPPSGKNLKPIANESCTVKMHDNSKREQLYDFGMYVAECLPKFVQKVQLQHTDELEILVAPEGIYQVCSFMRMHQNCLFAQCSSHTAIDVPTRPYRFEVMYQLLSFRYSTRVRIKTYTDELTPLRSQADNWKSAQWYEREVYDMFGIIFTHHPDLRRLLTDYGFVGHPLRKDFPLTGYVEVRYDDELKKLVYEPVEYAQEMRAFKLETPWSYFNSFHEGFSTLPEPTKKKE